MFGARDQETTVAGATTALREARFGAVKQDGSTAKGAYTQTVQDVRNPTAQPCPANGMTGSG